MSKEIEVPVGGIIKVYGSEMVCVEDFRDANDIFISCGACPIRSTDACKPFNCGGLSRTDGKSVHLEYYYG